MTETYVPQPGTIQARGIAFLKTLGAATSVPNALLAEELDVDAVDLAKAMHTAFERGAVSREIRDRQPWWGVGHPKARPLGSPPPVTADEDDVDDFPIVQRLMPATQEAAMNKPVTPPQTKKPRAAPVEFDPVSFELKQRPLPPAITGAGSRYQALLERMKPGDSIDVAPAIAKGLVSAAKKAKVKLATRVLSETVTGVWRL